MATYKSIRYLVPDEVVEHTDSINALADVNTSTVAPEIGQTLKWSAANSRWQPADIEESGSSGTEKAIFGFGGNQNYGIINLVSSSGVVATDTSTVGTQRVQLSGSGYGGDKAIMAFGQGAGQWDDQNNIFNLISNTGVIASDTTITGVSGKMQIASSYYGGDKAIFGFGSTADADYSFEFLNETNLVSNIGVMSTDVTGVGTERQSVRGASYGGDKAIFGFGDINSTYVNTINLISNIGIVSSDVTGVGTVRYGTAGAGFGGDKAIFAFGDNGIGSNPFLNVSNLVSNTGIVATDTTGIGTVRPELAAAGFGGDKAIFGFGAGTGYNSSLNMTNLVSNAGVVSSDVTGVGTARMQLAAAGYSTTA